MGLGITGVEKTTQGGALRTLILTKYYSGGKIEQGEMGMSCSRHLVADKCVKTLMGKPEGKRSLGRRRLRWEDNIKMDIQDFGLGHGLDSSGL